MYLEKSHLAECADFTLNFLKPASGCIKCQNTGVFVSWSLKYSILDFIYVFSIAKFNNSFPATRVHIFLKRVIRYTYTKSIVISIHLLLLCISFIHN